jgi:hypothetical protein
MKSSTLIIVLIGSIAVGTGVVTFLRSSVSYTQAETLTATHTSTTTEAVTDIRTSPETIATSSKSKVPTEHMPTPSTVKAIYMSQCAVGTPSLRNNLVSLIDSTELNAVVIDIKDYTGKLSFTPDDLSLKDSVSPACGATDMKAFIQTLHDKQIYVIGRITVFQDPYYTQVYPELAVKRRSDKTAVWKDYKGLAFIDVGAKLYWDYIVKIANASYDVGFDELNFDYIRFPSDGNMSDTYYSWDDGKSKPETLENFFSYLHDALKSRGLPISADMFGMVATNEDDVGIGQVLERAMPYFDYIDPMVYPSHYQSGFHGYTDVNAHPYDIVHVAMRSAVARVEATTTDIESFAYTSIVTSTQALYEKPVYSASKIRPWLQSFDYPVTYTPEMVKAQITATNDVGLSSYLVWDAANKYRSLREVVQPE